MPRKVFTILLPSLLLLFACSEEEPKPLTPDLVTEVRAYDLGNNGDASDIRVDFVVQNSINVREFRILVLRANDSSSFDLDDARSVQETSFAEITAQPLIKEYSVNRLGNALLDVGAQPVQNDQIYVVAVLVEGIDDFQLSHFTRPLVLIDRPIYSGEYEGTAEYSNIITKPHPSCPPPATANGVEQIRTTLTFVGIGYEGEIECVAQTCNSDGPEYYEGTLSIGTIDGSAVTDLSLIRIATCGDEPVTIFAPGCAPCAIGVDECNVQLLGTSGMLIDEVILELPLSGADCASTYEVTYNLRRL